MPSFDFRIGNSFGAGRPTPPALKCSPAAPMRRSSFTGVLMRTFSVVWVGTVQCTMRTAPRCTAARSEILVGTLASGVNGAPMYPQPAVSSTAATAPLSTPFRKYIRICRRDRSLSKRFPDTLGDF